MVLYGTEVFVVCFFHVARQQERGGEGLGGGGGWEGRWEEGWEGKR